MAWGTDFTTGIFLSRETYQNIYQVDDKIDEIDNDIEEIVSKLKMLAIANPKDILPKEWEDDCIGWVNSEVENLTVELEDYVVQSYKLQLYRTYLEDNEPIIPIEVVAAEYDKV